MKKQTKAYLEGEIDVNKLPKVGDEPTFTEDWEFKKRDKKKQVKKK